MNPGAADPCGDGLDLDCDGVDCPSWFEGFEFGINAPWVQGGNADWFAQGTTVHAGVSGGECGNINDSQTSSIEITKNFPAGGSVTFWHMGSTESGWDFLRVYIDNVDSFNRAGTWSWTETSLPLGPGSHTIRFAYTKDGSVSSGSDTVWVDDIFMDGTPP